MPLTCKRCDKITAWECLCVYCGWCVQCVLACGHRDRACTEYNEKVLDAQVQNDAVVEFP